MISPEDCEGARGFVGVGTTEGGTDGGAAVWVSGGGATVDGGAAVWVSGGGATVDGGAAVWVSGGGDVGSGVWATAE
nr:hypothetical protein OG999_26735 [Streptomyces sp. NBC_00886]